MIFYHADVHNKIHENMILETRTDWLFSPSDALILRPIIRNLYPYGLASYGARVLMRPANEEQWNNQLFEIILESVRAQRFSHLPSRLTSVFAARSPESARKWSDIILPDASVSPVYAVECSNAYIADAQILDVVNRQSDTYEPNPAGLMVAALRYWESCQSVEVTQPLSESQTYPKEEILLVPPVRVLYQV